MSFVGVLWIALLAAVGGFGIKGVLDADHSERRRGAGLPLCWLLLSAAFLWTNIPEGISPSTAAGLHLGAAVILGFVLHVLTRGRSTAADAA